MTKRARYISEEGPIRVLHVDDDACFLKTAKAILEMQGTIQVETASSVEEAVGKMKTEKYDVVVCDYQMPRKDGLQFLKELREKRNGIPFIIFTGKGREEVAIKALNLGADGYFSKMGHPETVYGELAHGISQAVETKKTEQKLAFQAHLLSSVHDALTATDENFIITYWNQIAEEMFGWTAKEAIGQTAKELFQTNVPGSSRTEAIDKLLKDGFYSGEVYYCRKGGTYVLTDVHSTAVRSPRGEFKGTVSCLRDITGRKKAEEQAEKTSEELTRTFDAITDFVFNIDRDYRIVRVNKKICEALKKKPEELVGKRCYEVVHGTDKPFPSCPHKRTLETGKAASGEINDPNLGLTLLVSNSPIFDERGELIQCVHVAKDITEHKKAVKSLLCSEEKFRNIFESATDVMVLFDATGRILDVNKKAVEAFGGSKGELVGKHFTRACLGIMSPTQISKVVKGFAAGLANKKPDLDVSIKSKKGQTILLECSGSLLKLDDKSTGLLVVGRDITERKRAEEELVRSERKYRSLVEQSLQGIVVAQGPAPHLVFANAAMSRILGYTPEELTSLSPQETTGLVHPEDRDVFFGRFKDRLEGKPALSRYEVRGIRKDGTVVWLELSSTGIEYNGHPAVQATFLNITERKKAEVALQESEERFRAIIESAPFGYYRVGKDGLWQYVNPVWERMHGLSLEEVVGKPFEITQTEDSVEQAKEYVKRALAGETIIGEFSRLTCEGDVEYHSFNIQPVKRNNEIVAIEGFINDITERRKAEEALKNSEERWRSLTEGSPDHIMLLDLEFNILYINRTVPDLKREEVIGTSLFNYVPPEWHRATKDCFKRVIETGKIDNYDAEYRTKDGEVRYFDVRVGPVFRGDRLVAFVSSSTDVTRQKKAQEEITRAEKVLKKGEAELSAIIENTSDSVWSINNKGCLLFANTTFKRQFLLTYGVELKEGMDLKEMVPKAQIPFWVETHNRAVKGGQFSLEQKLEIRGVSFDFEISVNPIINENGETVGAAYFSRDITERQKIFEQLRVLNEKLGVVGELTRHDVRNKLAAVVGNTYLTKKTLPNDHKALDYLQEIESACRQTTRVLDFAVAYESLGVEGLTLIEVDKAVEEAVSLISELKGVKVVNNCQGLTVMADSALRQLFFNLIDNSLKHGKNVSQIKIHYEEGKDRLKLFYEDNGVGIPKANKPKLFHVDFTAGKGSGYGLPLIKSMMEIYDWTIEEEGEPGKGAKFVITIPNTHITMRAHNTYP